MRKFLPSYEGPYFIVGVLDDLVYRIKKGQRMKMKVVHHDKLKAYHSRTALDNSWTFREAETWAPVEAYPVVRPQLFRNRHQPPQPLGHVTRDRGPCCGGPSRPLLSTTITEQQPASLPPC